MIRVVGVGLSVQVNQFAKYLKTGLTPKWNKVNACVPLYKSLQVLETSIHACIHTYMYNYRRSTLFFAIIHEIAPVSTQYPSLYKSLQERRNREARFVFAVTLNSFSGNCSMWLMLVLRCTPAHRMLTTLCWLPGGQAGRGVALD